MLTMSTLVAMATEEVVFYTHSSSNSKLLTDFISYIYYLLGREGGREGGRDGEECSLHNEGRCRLTSPTISWPGVKGTLAMV